MAEREWNLPDVFAKVISFGTNTQTLTGNKTLLFNDRRVQFLDPGGSDRDVILPSESLSDGIIFWITNTAGPTGNLLTVYASDGITLKAYLSGAESCFIMCDGTIWRAGATGSGRYGTDIPAGSSMWFNQDTASVGWTIDGTIVDELLAVKGGSQAYNVAGGASAGTWTQPDHTHDIDHYHYQGLWAHPTDLSGGYSSIRQLWDFKLSTWVYGGSWPAAGSDQLTVSRPCDIDMNINTDSGGESTPNTYRPKARVGIICIKD